MGSSAFARDVLADVAAPRDRFLAQHHLAALLRRSFKVGVREPLHPLLVEGAKCRASVE